MKEIHRKRQFLVLLTLISFLSISLITSAELKVTEEHPFYLDNKWVPAKDLKVGDTFQTINGKKAVIKSIKLVKPEKPFWVFNLEVPFFNNFVVGPWGLIVHNSDVIPQLNKKPPSWTTDDWNEYLLSKSKIPKRRVNVGNQIVHFEGDVSMPGSGGAVFFDKESNKKRVIKVFRGDEILPDTLFGKPREISERIENAVHHENYYIQEIENMKLADKLGLRKFYGEVEVDNLNRLLDSSTYPNNKNLLSRRAYSMDYVEGGFPREMKSHITDATLRDAIKKYRVLYDAGYVQMDFQFLVTREGRAEIIDWGSVSPKGDSSLDSWVEIEKKIRVYLGYSEFPSPFGYFQQ